MVGNGSSMFTAPWNRCGNSEAFPVQNVIKSWLPKLSFKKAVFPSEVKEIIFNVSTVTAKNRYINMKGTYKPLNIGHFWNVVG